MLRKSAPSGVDDDLGPGRSSKGSRLFGRDFVRQRNRQNPAFLEAVLEDARVTAACRGDRSHFRSRFDAGVQALRLMCVTDAFLAQVLYRAKSRLVAMGVPVLPHLAHRFAIAIGQVSIGDPVIMHPGIYLAHGQVVIDGFSEVHGGSVIFPFVTIGLRAGTLVGPTIGAGARIGTGAKVLGPVGVGARARVGANAVVLADVPPDATAIGVPARIAGASTPAALDESE
jgi:serine O-acetyltransferase